MTQSRKPHLTCSLLAAMTLVAGCASAPPAAAPEPEPKYQTVWPTPPEPAVIRYVSEITNFGIPEKKKKRFKDILGGEEESEEIQTLQRPFDVATDSRGRIFVGDAERQSVPVFDAEGKFLGEWGKQGIGAVATPLGLAVDAKDRLFVCDTDQRRVVVFGPDGNLVNTFGGTGVLDKPVGIAINETLDRVYVTDSRANRIAVFGLDGTLKFYIEGPFGEGLGGLFGPVAIDIDSKGNLWIADSMNYRVLSLDSEGGYRSQFGRLGNNIGEFTRIKGLALDADDHVYVSDVAFNNIQIFSPEGQLLLFFGYTGGGPEGFQMPASLHFDERGYLYVADQRNHRIKILQYLGEPEISSN